MTEQERNTRRVRVRNTTPYPAIVSSDYAPVTESDFALYYLQISRTLGLAENYGHPELQTLISLSGNNGGYSVLNYLVKQIQKGARYQAGDRVTIPDFFGNYTVEFRESRDTYGACLRAVVLGLEDNFQSLNENEAFAYLNAHGPLIDPYVGY